MEFSMQKFVVAAALLSLFVTPAAAAEFYVAQDPATKKCKIVEEKPDGKTMVMIGAGAYATKDEAKAARRAAAECPKKEKKADQESQTNQEEKPN
jgi:hypothetical protein